MWASVDNAVEYERLLNTTIVPGVTAGRITGSNVPARSLGTSIATSPGDTWLHLVLKR